MATRKVCFGLLFSIIIASVSSSSSSISCTSVTNGLLIPHEYNCQLYYLCENGYRVEFTCPSDRFFSYSRQACVEDAGATECVSGVAYCHNVAHDFFPDPYDCTKYVECYQGEYYTLQCPSGLRYNQVTKVCQDPALVQCVETPVIPVEAICYGVSANHIVLKSYPNYCQYYYKCDGATPSVGKCPDNMYFDVSREACDFENFVTCQYNLPGDPITDYPINEHPLVPTGDPRCTGYSYAVLIHPASCIKYIQCSDGLGYEMDCPTGMFFNEAYLRCVEPQLSPCATVVVTERPPPPDYDTSPDCLYPIADNRLLPFPGDCTKYYECADGIKIEMDCPAGLWWHQSIGECDYPYLSSCVP